MIIRKYVHIAVSSLLTGQGRKAPQDFSGASSRVFIFGNSDDYSCAAFTNPVVPSEYADVTHTDVTIGRHVISGAGSVLLPGVALEEVLLSARAAWFPRALGLSGYSWESLPSA